MLYWLISLPNDPPRGDRKGNSCCFVMSWPPLRWETITVFRQGNKVGVNHTGNMEKYISSTQNSRYRMLPNTMVTRNWTRFSHMRNLSTNHLAIFNPLSEFLMKNKMLSVRCCNHLSANVWQLVNISYFHLLCSQTDAARKAQSSISCEKFGPWSAHVCKANTGVW